MLELGLSDSPLLTQTYLEKIVLGKQQKEEKQLRMVVQR